MKIAVSARGKWLDSGVDEHVGRAAFFVVYDTTDESHLSLDNWRATHADHWAGPAAVDSLVQAGVAVLLTQRCGPCAFRQLSENDVEICYTADEPVSRAIKRYREGDLEPATRPNCDGHAHLMPERTSD